MWVIKRLALATVSLLAMAAIATAQGVQTGELMGTVTDSGGLVLPGVTITVKSPALQGLRTVVSDENGSYVIRALPPGTYEVTFELSGMATKTQQTVIELGRQSVANISLSVGGVQESVTVTGEVKTAGLTSPTVGANYDNERRSASCRRAVPRPSSPSWHRV